MSIKVAIFEDDKDVADLLKEVMEAEGFKATTYYSSNEINWNSCDIVLADYRNKIVNFNKLQSDCLKRNTPLIAISGADTDYFPQLIKPFSIEALKSLIFDTLKRFN